MHTNLRCLGVETRSRKIRLASFVGLAAGLLAGGVLTLTAAVGTTSVVATATAPLAAAALRDSATAPPVATRSRRQRGGVQRAVRLIATPATLPASGGVVHLRARVRNVTRCRFSSAGLPRQLPSTRRCASGRASILVRVPKNVTSAPRRYVLYLTVRGPSGARRRVRKVVVERPVVRHRSASGGSGVTLASGVNTHATGSGAASGQSSKNSGVLSSSPSAALNPPSAPAVTTQPVSQSVAVNTPVTFSAAASGNPTPSVQWQVSADGGASWQDTSPSFDATAGQDDDQYRAVFANQAGSAMSNVVTLTVQPMSTTNFSGYITYAAPGQSFSAVSANWTVPTVTCQPGETSWAAQWPGIGDNTTVQQDGTETDCFNGVPSYWAWYEMYGDPNVSGGYAVPLSASTNPVSAGDQMTGSVSFTGSEWVLALSDATQNWTFQVQFPSTPGLSQGSAEWMVEDPNGCSPSCEVLSQYSPVQFTQARATANGQSGLISSFPLTAMAIDQNSTTLATVGPLDRAGDGFTDSWLAG